MKIRARDLSALRIDRVEFASAGGVVRGLYYHTAEDREASCVVLCHGYSAAKHNVDPLAFYLAVEGWCAIAFDFLGHKLGASEGRLRTADDLVSNALDAVACARGLPGVARVVLGGHSMGAATAIGASVRDPGVAGVIAMCTALERSAGAADGPLAGGLSNRSQYVEGPAPSEITAVMDGHTALVGKIAPRPLLVIAASRDAIVAPSAVRELYDAAGEPKTFELVDATHTDCAERARFAIGKWLRFNDL